MTTPLSFFLTSFTASPPAALLVEPMAEIFDEDVIELPLDDTERRIEEAVAAARVEMASGHAVELAALAEAQNAAADAALASARSEWAEAEGTRLAALLDERLTELRTGLEKNIADVLRPILGQAVIDRTMRDLSAVLAKLLSDADHPVLRIKGPEDLLGILRDAHAEASIDWIIDNTAEIEIVAGATRVDTQLGAALAAVTASEI